MRRGPTAGPPHARRFVETGFLLHLASKPDCIDEKRTRAAPTAMPPRMAVVGHEISTPSPL